MKKSTISFVALIISSLLLFYLPMTVFTGTIIQSSQSNIIEQIDTEEANAQKNTKETVNTEPKTDIPKANNQNTDRASLNDTDNENKVIENGKYIVTKDKDNSLIGRFETLNSAVYAVPYNEPHTITLTENDLEIKEQVSLNGYHKITLTSDTSGPYKISTALDRHFSNISGDLILKNIILDGQEKGGGISILSNDNNPNINPTLSIKSGAIIQNCYNSNIGAIYSEAENVTITMGEGSIIHNNSSGFDGGGIFISQDNSLFLMNGGIIENNTANHNGGGIMIDYGCNLIINKGIIRDNNADSRGGAVFFSQNTDAKINTCEMKSNTSGSGGGLFIDENAKLHIEKSEIIENSAIFNGGGIVTYGKLSINNSKINNNTATNTGGGIYTNGTELIIDNSVIKENRTSHAGAGGVYLENYNEGTSAIIKNSIIEGNEGREGGGIQRMGLVSLFLENTKIIKNKASTFGGGIYTDDSDHSNPANENSYRRINTDVSTVFADNFASYGLFNPPDNTTSFNNIAFASTSLTGKNLIEPDHPLNNYDINYMGSSYVEILSITYNANGGKGAQFVDTATPSIKYTVRSSDEVSINKDGHILTKWNTAEDGSGTSYFPGENLFMMEDINLYAQWEKKATVNFETNGGSKIDPVQIKKGSLLNKPLNPTKTGYKFNGWYKNPELTEVWDFENDRVNTDMTLYAMWKKEIVTITPTTPTTSPKEKETNSTTIGTKKAKTIDNNSILLFASLTGISGLGAASVLFALKNRHKF